MSDHFKGIFATTSTGIAGTIAWLPAIETVARIGVSVAGICAGIYASIYWHRRAQAIRIKKEEDEA